MYNLYTIKYTGEFFHTILEFYEKHKDLFKGHNYALLLIMEKKYVQLNILEMILMNQKLSKNISINYLEKKLYLNNY